MPGGSSDGSGMYIYMVADNQWVNTAVDASISYIINKDSSGQFWWTKKRVNGNESSYKMQSVSGNITSVIGNYKIIIESSEYEIALYDCNSEYSWYNTKLFTLSTETLSDYNGLYHNKVIDSLINSKIYFSERTSNIPNNNNIHHPLFAIEVIFESDPASDKVDHNLVKAIKLLKLDMFSNGDFDYKPILHTLQPDNMSLHNTLQENTPIVLTNASSNIDISGNIMNVNYLHPFQNTLETMAYNLVDRKGCLIFPKTGIVNESLGWNKQGYHKPDVNINDKIKKFYDMSGDLQKFIEHNTKISVRGGGHDYNNASLAGNFIITFPHSLESPFHKIAIKNISVKGEKTPMLYMGNKVRFGELYLYLHNYKKINNGKTYDFVGGSCSNVGVAGFILGGGQSYISAHTGPACHYLYGVESITADGKVQTFTEDTHPEDMYVIRGGGHSKPFLVTTFICNLKTLEATPWACLFIRHKFENNQEDQGRVKQTIKQLNNLRGNSILGPVNIESIIDAKGNRYINKIDIVFLEKATEVDLSGCSNINIPPYFKTSEWQTLLCTTKNLFELYTTEIGDHCSFNGSLTTMWPWGDNVDAENFGKYGYNAIWSSSMGEYLNHDVCGNTFCDFIGLDHYTNVDTSFAPYANNSIFPPIKKFTGWTTQAYTNIEYSLDQQKVPSIESVVQDIESTLNIVTHNNNNTLKYRYTNYPPTYIVDNSNKFNELTMYFDGSGVDKINIIKNKHDPNNKFTNDYDIIM